ncbi:MAG: hypothetical protein NTY38_18575, partial [Acidobacteria bacterium]|nr:hypothetical protein [Acidobacteriota bacterium]
LMLVHGTNATSETWELPVEGTSLVGWLEAEHIPYFHKIDLVPNGWIDKNGTLLKGILEKQAIERGVESVHLIAHSKGAPAARWYLSNLYKHGKPLKVLSLYSLGTPSQGTVLSDVAVEIGHVTRHDSMDWSQIPDAQRKLIETALEDSSMANYLAPAGKSPSDPARQLQRTDAMHAWNLALNPKPSEVPYFSIAGDADADGDGAINDKEASAFGLPTSLAQEVYDTLGRLRSVELKHQQTVETGERGYDVWKLQAAANSLFAPNDLVSTGASVHCAKCGFRPLSPLPREDGRDPLLAPRNHSQLKCAEVMAFIWAHIKGRFLLTGGAQ